MKVKISVLFFLCLMMISLSVNGQKRSTIQINTGGYYIPGYASLDKAVSDFWKHPGVFNANGYQRNYKAAFAMIGIKYEYTVWENVSAFFDYTLTGNQNKYLHLRKKSNSFAIESSGNLELIRRKYGYYYYDKNGVLDKRLYYQFFTTGLSYKYDKLGHSSISFDLGLSFAFGYNSYLTRMVLASPMPEGSGDVMYADYRTEHEGYWGAVGGLNYDYLFWENRISAGADIHFRYYEGSMPFFMNYGLHVGYHF